MRPISHALVLLTTLAMAPIVQAQTPTPLATVRIVGGLHLPVYATAHPADLDRLFVLEQQGRVRIVDLRTNTLLPTPYLTITPLSWGGERGLLGMAFHPDFSVNGYFFVYYNRTDGRVCIARYRADGDPLTATTADPASAEVVLTVPGYPSIHNGGWISFGPDGYLYIATGDGGGPNRSQSIVNQLAGKILRIDVDGPDNIPGNEDDDGFPDDPLRLYTIPPDNPFVDVQGDDEIWAYGLRNPWRNDIDPLTGDLFIADVGSFSWEEINYQPANPPGAFPGYPSYQGGRNYGWSCYEGLQGPSCPTSGELVFPFLVYGRSTPVPPTMETGCAVTGGVVYRGCAIPDLDGTYFFTDFCRNIIFSLRYTGDQISDFRRRTELNPGADGSIMAMSSFGRDARGEIYFCSHQTNGALYKIVPQTLIDVNGDGVADSCRCPADWNGDDVTNSTDISAFIAAWLDAVTNGTTAADYNRDGLTNSADISAFITSWLASLTGGC